MGEKKLPLWKYEDYSDWSRQIARTTTREEIEKKIRSCERQRGTLGQSALRAIEKTTSMQSNAWRRAQTGNSKICNYETMQAYKNALEIYEFYPEKTLEGKQCEEK